MHLSPFEIPLERRWTTTQCFGHFNMDKGAIYMIIDLDYKVVLSP